MAKIALPLLLSLSLVLSNQSIVGDEEELAPEPTEQNTSEGYGILPPQESMPLENSPAPRYPRDFGPGTRGLIDRGGLFPIDPPIANPRPLGPRTSALTNEGGSPEMAIDEGGLVAQNPATNMPIDEGGLYTHNLTTDTTSDEAGHAPY
ncbi:hypothetical protein GOBAR_DD02748 [Gossypium barbadense]|nr:hypothetical protein GOBAR_DD02748 [Gossypium barbadense]